MIDDLARDRLTDRAICKSADLHAASCAACARRLADERSLASGLRSLAAIDAQCEAPARVEAALMEAFRERSRVSQEASVQVRGGLAFRLGWVAATAAAAILLIVALATSRVEQAPPAEEQVTAKKPDAPEKKEKPEPEQKREPKAQPKKKRLVLLQAGNASSKRARKKPPADARDSKGALGDEIATTFFPIMPAGGLSQVDGGQLVRVEMPRSALVSFGLPMNIERANERIKADVLIGNDGVARAIRFVR
ncbi:MAG TPA: hypothetical protein VNO14_02570 [Blastocatellia bacterium]|nr:hypothetical protein [Blastocatellia bacterium]